MAQDHIKKEALFNEVKGSLFEYLVAKEMAKLGQDELDFQNSIDLNYLNVLSQQDRMVRQFYPEMLPFLSEISKLTSARILNYCGNQSFAPKLTGKFSNSQLHEELHEADLLLKSDKHLVPVSLKLNKKNAYVNTKSGGIKSFFAHYFPFLPSKIQEEFNRFVDLEFNRISIDLHELHELDYSGDYKNWVKAGLSELPGEQNAESRIMLKQYYARIAQRMHQILSEALRINLKAFSHAMAPLMGFGHKDILQVICYHDFPVSLPASIEIHSFTELEKNLHQIDILPFNDIASVELIMGNWSLHIRVKPMNKFTTSAMKINCSVRVKSPT